MMHAYMQSAGCQEKAKEFVNPLQLQEAAAHPPLQASEQEGSEHELLPAITAQRQRVVVDFNGVLEEHVQLVHELVLFWDCCFACGRAQTT